MLFRLRQRSTIGTMKLQGSRVLCVSRSSATELSEYKDRFAVFVKTRETEFKRDALARELQLKEEIKRLKQDIFMTEHGQLEEENAALQNAYLSCSTLTTEVEKLKAQARTSAHELLQFRQAPAPATQYFVPPDIRHPTLHMSKTPGVSRSAVVGGHVQASSSDEWWGGTERSRIHI